MPELLIAYGDRNLGEPDAIAGILELGYVAERVPLAGFAADLALPVAEGYLQLVRFVAAAPQPASNPGPCEEQRDTELGLGSLDLHALD